MKNNLFVIFNMKVYNYIDQSNLLAERVLRAKVSGGASIARTQAHPLPGC